MSGQGFSATYKMTRRDHSFKNTRHGEHIQVPVFSSDPPVSHGGEFYWNSSTLCMNYSDGVDSWRCIVANVTMLANAGNGRFGLVADGVGPDLSIKSIDQGNGISIKDVSNVLTISANLQSVGAGCPLVLNGYQIKSIANGKNIDLVCGPTVNISLANNVNITDLTVTGNTVLQNANITDLTVTGNTVLQKVEINDSLDINCKHIDAAYKWAARVDGAGFDSGRGVSATSDAVYGTGVHSSSASNVYNANNTVFTTLTPSFGAYIVKWNSSGAAKWATKVDGLGVYVGFGISSICDSVYGTGFYSSSGADVYSANGTGVDYFSTLVSSGIDGAYVVKWDENGKAQWATKVDGTGSDKGQGISATCDSVYGTGFYSSSGANVYSGNGNSTPIYFSNLVSIGSDAAYIVKWDSDGAAQWATKVDGGASDKGFGISTTCDAVYGTGSYETAAGFYDANGNNAPIFSFGLNSGSGQAAYIIKYDSNGQIKWCAPIQGPPGTIGYGIAATCGDVYATGQYTNIGGVFNGAVPNNGAITLTLLKILTSTSIASYIVKWNTDGKGLWATKIDGSLSEKGYGIAATCEAVYCTGFYETGAAVYNADDSLAISLPAAGTDSSYIVKYDKNGYAKWAVTIENISGLQTNGISVSDRSVYATGSYFGPAAVKLILLGHAPVTVATLQSENSSLSSYIIKIEDDTYEKINNNADVHICSDVVIDGTTCLNGDLVLNNATVTSGKLKLCINGKLYTIKLEEC
jgi:hypothetical protein